IVIAINNSPIREHAVDIEHQGVDSAAAIGERFRVFGHGGIGCTRSGVWAKQKHGTLTACERGVPRGRTGQDQATRGKTSSEGMSPTRSVMSIRPIGLPASSMTGNSLILCRLRISIASRTRA